MNRQEFSVVIVAGGKGKRFGGYKQFAKVYNKEILWYATKNFEQHPKISNIIVVAPQEMIEKTKEILKDFKKVQKIVEGGEERMFSVFNGLKEVKTEFVLIHDGARPYVDKKIIDNLLEKVKNYPAIIPAIPLTDTIKFKDNEFVYGNPKRDRLLRVQTPQAFKTEILKKSFEKYFQTYKNFEKIFTDESGLVEEMMGIKSKWIEGDENNLKITYKDDIKKFENLLKNKEKILIGFGYDIHPIKEIKGESFILGGIEIAQNLRSIGHSDGDALIHALIDALLGAFALKDIGEYFPDTDKRFKNIKSTILLKKVVEEILPPFKINNIDIIVKLEKPKLSPFKEKIKENLSRLLDIEESCISIKAKRGEGLGVVGRGEAVEVFCVVNLSSLNLNY